MKEEREPPLQALDDGFLRVRRSGRSRLLRRCVAHARQPLARLHVSVLARLLLDVRGRLLRRDLRIQDRLLRFQHRDLSLDADGLARERVVLQRHSDERRPDQRGADEDCEEDQPPGRKSVRS